MLLQSEAADLKVSFSFDLMQEALKKSELELYFYMTIWRIFLWVCE